MHARGGVYGYIYIILLPVAYNTLVPMTQLFVPDYLGVLNVATNTAQYHIAHARAHHEATTYMLYVPTITTHTHPESTGDSRSKVPHMTTQSRNCTSSHQYQNFDPTTISGVQKNYCQAVENQIQQSSHDVIQHDQTNHGRFQRS